MIHADVHIAAHPVRAVPYDKLRFERLDQNRVPLYSVEGVPGGECAAPAALDRAFKRYGGRCFYCDRRFEPQPFSPEAVHRDHVHARKDGGSNLLHNLVIACVSCDRIKGCDPIHDFRPKAAKQYLAALQDHLARCVREAPGV